MRKFVLASLVVLLVGCGSPTIDTSTEEAAKASIAKVREALPEAKRAEFDKAVQLVAFNKTTFAQMMADSAAGVEPSPSRTIAVLNGKTGEAVIAEGQKIEAERKAKEREQALGEIKELQAKKVAAENAKLQLAKFTVSRSRFYKRKDTFADQPIIELTVSNGTGSPISRAYFSGTLASPNRSVPWLNDEFNYPISGGLEPGEEAQWSLAPNRFSDWGDVELPADAVLTVEVVRLDGADGNELYSTNVYTESDEDRLKKLLAEYGVSGLVP